MKNKFLILDCEYGGNKQNNKRSYDYSVLEIAMEVTDSNFEVLDSLFIKIKPKNGKYKVNKQVMIDINYDLDLHKKESIDYRESQRIITKFIQKNSDNGKIKLIPVGKQVSEDLNYLKATSFIDEWLWNSYCSFESIDVGSIFLTLKSWGMFPQTKNLQNKKSNSLEALAMYFNIDTSNHHCAKNDVIITRELFLKLKGLIKTPFNYK